MSTDVAWVACCRGGRGGEGAIGATLTVNGTLTVGALVVNGVEVGGAPTWTSFASAILCSGCAAGGDTTGGTPQVRA